MSSIFLSHSSKDKAFVNRLATDLRRLGYYVWTDDAEIKVGDSLIQKIGRGIDRVAYVGAVISHNSVTSDWVAKELDIAMNQEIEGRRVKVLPLLLEDVELPGFLKGKRYADFRDERKYGESLMEIRKRLDEAPLTESGYSPGEASDMAQQLKKLEKELNVSQSEKELFLARLQIERESLPPDLVQAIDKEKDQSPEFEDINRNFAFVCGGIPVTAGYVLHAMRKEMIKGGAHQIVFLAEYENKTKELALLVGATIRRLQQS